MYADIHNPDIELMLLVILSPGIINHALYQIQVFIYVCRVASVKPEGKQES